MLNKFHYKIDKEALYKSSTKLPENVPLYTELSLETQEPFDLKGRKVLEEGFQVVVAFEFNVGVDYVIPITEREYKENDGKPFLKL